MDDYFYAQIVQYKSQGILPSSFPSTKGNFIQLCEKFDLEEQVLKRYNKTVLKHSQLDGKHHNTRQNTN